MESQNNPVHEQGGDQPVPQMERTGSFLFAEISFGPFGRTITIGAAIGVILFQVNMLTMGVYGRYLVPEWLESLAESYCIGESCWGMDILLGGSVLGALSLFVAVWLKYIFDTPQYAWGMKKIWSASFLTALLLIYFFSVIAARG